MPKGYSNYDFVVNSSFRPYSFSEMIQPLAIYKEAYDKAEEQYLDLTDRSDKFKYLSETLPEGSKARQIYEGYANELEKQAADLSKNGLNMGNRRSLTNLRRRYQGEIGRLVSADTAMEEERKLRRTMNAKDSSMLYANDNLSIDDFLDNTTPNLYNISGTELYTRGAAAGKAASSRIYNAGDEGSTLHGYYRKWVERNGYSKESIDAFRANASAIPELQQAAENILMERGVLDNLTGNNLKRARQSVLDGIIDGAVYQEKANPVRDPGVMSAAEKDSSARGWAGYNLQKQEFNMKKQDWEDTRKLKYTFDEKGNVTGLNPDYIKGGYTIDPNTNKLKKKSSTLTAEERKAATEQNKKDEVLLKLKKKDLEHNEGFDVTFGDNKHHYDYIGAISKHGNKWHTGSIGEDNPGHWGWGFMSTSNVENKWGNFSAEGSSSDDMRVLSADEVQKLCARDPEILSAIEKRLKANKMDGNQDIQLIEVPNEWGSDENQKGYLIAVH